MTRLVGPTVFLLVCACNARSARVADFAPRREAAYDRVTRTFQRAVFYKPRAAAHPLGDFAPLIAIEVPGSGSAPTTPRLGHVESDGAAPPRFVPENATVYATSRRVTLKGRELEQRAYGWCAAEDAATDGETCHGYVVTIGSNGFPLIWAVFDRPSRLTTLYVSAALEARVKRQFGPPLEHRRFSIERSVEEAPDTVVVRALDDGPAPMGPWVYVGADGRVTTLLCRCMESQVRTFDTTIEYDLVTADPGSATTQPMTFDRATFPLTESADPAWLERVLRLPEEL